MDFENMKEELLNIEQVQKQQSRRHEKLRQQTKIMNVSTEQQANSIIHANNNGCRQSIQFEHKAFYTFEELLVVMNMLDEAWEKTTEHNNFTYVQ